MPCGYPHSHMNMGCKGQEAGPPWPRFQDLLFLGWSYIMGCFLWGEPLLEPPSHSCPRPGPQAPRSGILGVAGGMPLCVHRAEMPRDYRDSLPMDAWGAQCTHRVHFRDGLLLTLCLPDLVSSSEVPGQRYPP